MLIELDGYYKTMNHVQSVHGIFKDAENRPHESRRGQDAEII
jgi:hypothetical protein